MILYSEDYLLQPKIILLLILLIYIKKYMNLFLLEKA